MVGRGGTEGASSSSATTVALDAEEARAARGAETRAGGGSGGALLRIFRGVASFLQRAFAAVERFVTELGSAA